MSSVMRSPSRISVTWTPARSMSSCAAHTQRSLIARVVTRRSPTEGVSVALQQHDNPFRNLTFNFPQSRGIVSELNKFHDAIGVRQVPEVLLKEVNSGLTDDVRQSTPISLDKRSHRTYTVRVDHIGIGTRISWKRSYDDTRMFGYVVRVGGGFYVAKSEGTGLRFALRGREITREEHR